MAGRSAAACAGAASRRPLGPGAGRTPGGATAARGGGVGAGVGAATSGRRARGEPRPAVRLAPRGPRRSPRASLPRPSALPALPAGGERGLLAAVAVALPGSPEEARKPPGPARCCPAPRRRRLGAAAGRPAVRAGGAAAAAGERLWARRGARGRPREFLPRRPGLAAAPAGAESPAWARLLSGPPGGGGSGGGAHRPGPDE